jgi:hypothetical protein
MTANSSRYMSDTVCIPHMVRVTSLPEPTTRGQEILKVNVDMMCNGDVQGWSAGVGLDICEVLTWFGRRDLIPDAVGYRPGPLCPDVTDYPAAIFVYLLNNTEVTTDDLVWCLLGMMAILDSIPESERY